MANLDSFYLSIYRIYGELAPFHFTKHLAAKMKLHGFIAKLTIFDLANKKKFKFDSARNKET